MERTTARSAVGRITRDGGQSRTPSLASAGPDLVLAAALLVATLVVAATSVPFAIDEPPLDIALMAVGTTVLVEVAARSYGRFHEAGEGLLEAAGFLVLAAANLVNLAAVITRADAALGLTLADPGQLPLYFWAAARLLSAGLIAAGAVLGPRRVGGSARTAALLWGPTVLLGVACAALWLLRDSIPVLVDPETLRTLADEASRPSPLPGVNPEILLLDGSAAVLLVVAAVAYARAGRGAAGIPRTYMVRALILVAFSQLHFILYPAVYSGLVSIGDVLRLTAYVVLAAGVQAGTRRDLGALRSANGRLRFLALAEADRTAIAERARLARELHDGLAQDLWTAKLELDRLGAELDAGEAARGAAQFNRVRVAVEAARAEAQDAVHALRTGFDAGTSLQEELPRRLDAFTERTGFRVSLEVDGRVDLHGVPAAEVLRVVEEALRNVEKHADATAIRVRLVATSEGASVAVEDNGHGFDPSVPTAGHGLLGMQERASLLGGALTIRSAPGDGTRVELLVPVTGYPR